MGKNLKLYLFLLNALFAQFNLVYKHYFIEADVEDVQCSSALTTDVFLYVSKRHESKETDTAMLLILIQR